MKIANKLWQSAFIPHQWREAVVIPIPKPEKNQSNLSNYRPISLTSYLGKSMERMINRMLWSYLEINNVISNIQCGSRMERSTTDHLVRLKNFIRKAFARNEHCVSVFYDLKKACDTTWRYGILRDLYDIELRGNLSKYISAFLRDRRLRVRFGQNLSDSKGLDNGVPQGSILSVTLFLIKINQIASHITSDHNIYVDDLQIACRHTDLTVIQEKLQSCLDRVTAWTTYEGFRFSTTKTKMVHFTQHPGAYVSPTLKLYGEELPYEDNFQFLGMVWDRRLTWIPHINKLKADCIKRLGVMRAVASHEWGGGGLINTR